MRTKEKILGHTSTNHPFGDRMLEVLIDIRDVLATLMVTMNDIHLKLEDSETKLNQGR